MLIMPCRGLLKACAMYLPDLWQSRRCLQKIKGFHHSMANSVLGACGDLPAAEESPFLPFFVWQCREIKTLSQIVTILEFDFSKPINPCSGKAQVPFREAGICHGFVVWIDWVMDAEDNASIISTGPDERCWKQAVKLLLSPWRSEVVIFQLKSKHSLIRPMATSRYSMYFTSEVPGDLTIQHILSGKIALEK